MRDEVGKGGWGRKGRAYSQYEKASTKENMTMRANGGTKTVAQLTLQGVSRYTTQGCSKVVTI